MNTLLNRRTILMTAALGAGTTLLQACGGGDEEPQRNIVEIAQSNPDLSILVEAVVAAGAAEALAARALAAKAKETLLALLPHAERLEVGTREALFLAVAEATPSRRPSMLRELATLRRDAGRHAEAVETLSALAALVEVPAARAVLHIERGDALRMDAALDFGSAAAFERAIADHLAAHPDTRAVMLIAHPMNWTDATGADAFGRVRQQLRARGVTLHLVGLKLPVERVWRSAGHLEPGDDLRLHRTETEALQALTAGGPA